MNEEGYTKQGRHISETSFRCPENTRPYSERILEPTDYLLNSNKTGIDTWGDLGGGLNEAIAGATGCRQAHILNASKFILFAEVDEYADDTIHHLLKTVVASPKCFSLGSNANMNNYQHGQGSNYGFADGHAETIRGDEINWRYFSIRSTTYYDKYSPLNPL
jgi:prepilin-type processing-associated H-X9-DG protein